jgi:4-amino-4-deoxy-L-arabinose transferase-like glycosyltransferase
VLGLPRLVLAGLALVLIAGAVLRFDNVSRPNPAQSNDERAYVMLGRTLADRGHYGYDRETKSDPVHWPPGAPVFFATAMKLSGERPPDKGEWHLPTAYAFQAAVATLTILAAFALALIIAGPYAGLAAATVVAFYPPLIYTTSDLLSEPLGGLLLTSGLAMTAYALRSPRAWRLIVAGVLLGLTILTRADLALVPAIAAAVVAVAAWRRAARPRRWRGALRGAVLLGGAAFLVVLPWTVYASTSRDELVPLTSGGGSNLWMGTYLPGGGTLFGAKREWTDTVRHIHPGYRDTYWEDIPQTYVLEAVARRHPGLERDAALRVEARANLRRYALGQPFAFGRMMLRKAWRMWGKPPTGSGRVERAWITWLHRTLLAVALIGLLAALAITRRAELALIALSVAYVTVLNMILVSEARHLVTSVPSLAAGGAAGFALLIPRIRASASRRRRPASPRLPSRTYTSS